MEVVGSLPKINDKMEMSKRVELWRGIICPSSISEGERKEEEQSRRRICKNGVAPAFSFAFVVGIRSECMVTFRTINCSSLFEV